MRLDVTFQVEEHDELDSTQTNMRDRLMAGEEVAGLVVRAMRQGAGRGRRGRSWSSPPGGSYQTAAVRDPAPPALRGGGCSLAVAMAIAESLTEALGEARGDAAEGQSDTATVRVKWPNDLYLVRADRDGDAPGNEGARLGGKLGGVLIEYVRGHLLIGVGINGENVPPAGAASLPQVPVERLHQAVLDGISAGLGAVLAGAPLARRFATWDLLAGKLVRVLAPDGVHEGVGDGVAEDGALRLRTAAGEVVVRQGTVLAWR